MVESNNEMDELMKQIKELKCIDFDAIEKRLNNAAHLQSKESKFMTRAEVTKISWYDFEKRMEAKEEFSENVKRQIEKERIEESKMLDKMTKEKRFEYYSKKCDRVQEDIERKKLNYVT